jgi:hypothetical protein
VKYKINEHIPACHVNKDFLDELEDYIKSKIPNLIGISKKILSEKYSITISDEKGKEEINSISNYTSSLFPDSIKDIEINVFIFREKDFQLNINFNKEQLGLYSNNIEISYESKKAREIVLGIHEGIKQIIESYRNHNEFYHLSIYNDIFIYPASAFFFYVSLMMLSKKYFAFFVISFFVGLLILIYSVIGKKFKPFITFETNHYFRVKKSYNAFKAILITILATILITYIMGFWEKLKAWIK